MVPKLKLHKFCKFYMKNSHTKQFEDRECKCVMAKGFSNSNPNSRRIQIQLL